MDKENSEEKQFLRNDKYCPECGEVIALGNVLPLPVLQPSLSRWAAAGGFRAAPGIAALGGTQYSAISEMMDKTALRSALELALKR